MPTSRIVLLLLIGIALLIGSILLRVISKGKYEIKTIDLVFIIIPLLFAGLISGKIKGLDIFGIKTDFSDLFNAAANQRIEQQVSSVPVSPVSDAVEMIEAGEKRGLEEIPRLIEQKTEALAFQLAYGGYYGRAIKEYLNDLYGSSYLKYVIINNPDGTLFGMYNAVDLIAYLRTMGDSGYDRFERMLNDGDSRARAWLARTPGFIPVDEAVDVTMSKRNALKNMEKSGLTVLPVINEQNKFIGTINREQLTTSLILTVTNNISE
ncbi:MAG: hypothetical protein GF313_01860 [Caldithrix sp.]|nr:hypothetical protein [Caldithrix sp.]